MLKLSVVIVVAAMIATVAACGRCKLVPLSVVQLFSDRALAVAIVSWSPGAAGWAAGFVPGSAGWAAE